jgi:nitroreductase
MDAIEVLKTRRSVRTYKGEPVPRNIIEDIVDCGRLAATAVNIQPWEFIVVTDPEVLRRIAKTTDYGKFIADAPGCVLVLCRDTRYWRLSRKSLGLNRQTHASRGVKPGYAAGAVACTSPAFAWASTV